MRIRQFINLILFTSLAFFTGALSSYAQDASQSLKDADALYKEYKMSEALSIYKSVFTSAEESCQDQYLESFHKFVICKLFNKDTTVVASMIQFSDCARSLNRNDHLYNALEIHAEYLRQKERLIEAQKMFAKQLAIPNLTDQQKLAPYNRIAYSARYTDIKKSEKYANMALSLATEIKDTQNIAEAYGAMAIIEQIKGHYAKAISYNLKRTPLLANQNKVFKILEVEHSLFDQFFTLRDYNRCHRYLESIHEKVDTNLHKVYYSSILNREGKLCLAEHKYQEAIAKFKQATNRLPVNKYPFKHFTSYFGLHNCYKQLAIADSTIYWENKMISLLPKLNSDRNRALVHRVEAERALAQNNYSLALKKSEEAFLFISKTSDQQSLPSLHKMLGRIYEEMGQTSKSIAAYSKSYAMQDSFEALWNQELTLTLENEYTQTIQNQALDELSSEATLTDIGLAKRKNQLMGISAFSLLLIGLGGFFFNQNKKIKTQNITIARSTEDRKFLLKEIHHRVKNNLQVISSLLKLQSRYIEDPTALLALTEGRTRVNALAILHQNLYQDDLLRGVNIREYTEELVDNLFRTFKDKTAALSFENHVDQIIFNMETLIPLSLIINECVSNAIQFSFPNAKGKIEIHLKEKNDTIILSIEDNGIPGEASSKVGNNKLGQKIIEAYSNKLKATTSYSYTNGTNIQLIIRSYKKA